MKFVLGFAGIVIAGVCGVLLMLESLGLYIAHNSMLCIIGVYVGGLLSGFMIGIISNQGENNRVETQAKSSEQ